VRKLLWSALVLCAGVTLTQADTLRRVRVEADNAPDVARNLERAGYDVLEGSVQAGEFQVVVSVEHLQNLIDLGLKTEVIEIGRPLRDIIADQMAIDSIPAGYPDLAGIYAEMNAKAAAFPAICQVVDLNVRYGTPTTYEGRHLFAAKVSDNVASDENEPAVLIIANFHAREVNAVTVVLYALNMLTSQYGVNPAVTNLVDNYEIWLAPTWNPDGYNYVYTVDNDWRKNRHVFSGGTGVDCNRNFPVGWESTCSGDLDPASETFKGPSVASEGETKTLMAWSQERHFTRVIDYHSYGREVLRSYVCLTYPWATWVDTEAAGLAAASGYSSTRDPSADGEHYEWQFAYMGAGANLIEIGAEFQPTYASAQSEAAQLWPGIIYAINRAAPLWGFVTNEVTGQGIPAAINYPSVSFVNGETNAAGRFGRYNIFAPPGTYTLALTLAGYENLTLTSVPITATSTQLNIPMTPAPPMVHYNGGEQVAVNVPTTISWLNPKPDWRYQVQVAANYGSIGNVVDSFERTTLGTDYVTGGDAPWSINTLHALAGTRAARAGSIGNSQSSWMTRSAGPGNISFWYFVSSEANGDFFNFYIDGTRLVHASGAGAWTQFTQTLGAGQHELKWEYAKNASTIGGSDSVWVDYLQLVADNTNWVDVTALTPLGASATAWTPTTLGTTYRVRARSYHADATYGPWGMSAANFTVANVPVLVGDLNCSGAVGFDDINPFVQRLTDPAGYAAAYPSCPAANADINGNGSVGFDDINPFVALLTGH
jgi:hypothetical protein